MVGLSLKNAPFVQSTLLLPRLARQQWRKWREKPVEETFSRLASIVVGDITLDVPEFGGEFALSPHSHLFQRLARHGSYEPVLSALFLSHIIPDRDVVDVGANVGFFTVAAAKAMTSGRVLAIEPVPAAFFRLTHNLQRNHVAGKVILFNGLASDREAQTILHVIPGKEEYSSVAEITHPSVSGHSSISASVSARTLDSLVLENRLRPAVIKMDVEGAEGLVFAGGRETLVEHRPIVISELSDALLRKLGTTSRELIAEYEKLNYSVYDPLDPQARPGTKPYGDVICIPN